MISPEEIRRVAALAALDVSDSEVETLSRQLSRILDYCEMVARTGNGEGGKSPGPARAPLREDEHHRFDPPIDVEAVAPDGTVKDGMFSVPKVTAGE